MYITFKLFILLLLLLLLLLLVLLVLLLLLLLLLLLSLQPGHVHIPMILLPCQNCILYRIILCFCVRKPRE